MAVASLVLGIVSIIIAWIPFCGAVAFIPAIVGIVLGIISWVKNSKNSKPLGMSIAGSILSGLSIIFICFWIFIVGTTSPIVDEFNTQLEEEMKNYYENNDQ